MRKFELNEIAYYEQDDYTFAPCFCLITKVPETHTHYYIVPLDAEYVLRNRRYIPDNGFFAAPGALRKIAQPVIVAHDDPASESEPEEVAPAKEPEPQDISRPDELTKLHNAFTLMRDMVDPNRNPEPDPYLYCPNSPGTQSACGVCPFDMKGECGIRQIYYLIAQMRGASDSSL